MDKIIISKAGKTVTMPRVRKVAVSGENVGKSIAMASGKIVSEIVGHRVIITAEWDWLPAQTIANLYEIIRMGGFCEVTYPDPEKGEQAGMFAVSPPDCRIFAFDKNGNPRWRGVSLTLTAQNAR